MIQRSRRTPWIAILALLPILVGGGVVAGASHGDERGNSAVQHAQEPSRDERAQMRERWDSLTETERARLRERYAELQKLDPAERERMQERARGLEQFANRMYRGLDPVTRRRLESLEPDKRREILQEMVVAEAKDMGRRILRKLPEEDRERLERATEEQRIDFLLQFRRRMNERISRTFDTLDPAQVGLTPAEFEQMKTRLAHVPMDERRWTYLEIVKRRALRIVERTGLPDGLPDARWQATAALAPDEFYVTLLHLRRSFPELGVHPSSRPNGPRDANVSQRLERSMYIELTAEERVALSHLSRPERGAELQRRRRKRATAVLREEGFLAAPMLEELEAAPDDEFFRRMRQMITRGTGREGPGARPGERPGDRPGRERARKRE